ncbi:MAG TPA: hypothetical protein VFV92_07875, partial [Candidatus Bathyarchaeia archaeon]|nr:hypothetical protein [Candidatus Bathyarchaeia archaeon]
QGTGKSRFVGRLLSTLDPHYIPSMENHPVYTKSDRTATKCHISISLMPFLRAVVDELLLMRQGKRGDLPPGSWWHIDEPTDALSIEWWKKTAKILGKFLMRNGYMRVNVAICAQIKGKTLGYLRELCNAWVRMRRPGQCTVFKMESRINYKSVTRPEYTKPVGLFKVRDETSPPPRWDELYGPIKDANAIQGALEDILDLQTVTKQDPELKQWLSSVKDKMGYETA